MRPPSKNNAGSAVQDLWEDALYLDLKELAFALFYILKIIFSLWILLLSFAPSECLSDFVLQL